jgi:vacuolar protein sorting-associated protein 13A/C
VEAPTAETDLVIPRRNAELHLGVSWTPGSGIYKLTKIITLAPRFIIKNNSETPISYRELGGPLPEQPEISPGAKVSIHWTRRGPDKMLKFKYPGLNGEWYCFSVRLPSSRLTHSRSAPISMEDIGSVHIRVQPIDAPPSDVHLWRADVEVEGATIFITLNRESGDWPYRLFNESDYEFIVLQSVGNSS